MKRSALHLRVPRVLCGGERLGLFVFVICVLISGSEAFAQDGSVVYRDHCASCHDRPAARVPSRETISALSADRIVDALTNGLMRVQGEELTPAERRAVATALSTARPGAATGTTQTTPTCAASTARVAPTNGGDWNGWGVDLANNRFQRQPGLTAAQVPSLTLKWAFGFEGETTAAAQPAVVGQHVFVGSASGRVYALGLHDGCLHWTFKADGGVRGGIVVGPPRASEPASLVAFFGDLRATAYALDAATGELKWKRKLDDHRAARISGTPVLYNGRLYVPIASGEEGTAGAPNYQCCTFRGSLVALDAATGEQVWRTYTISEEPKAIAANAAGAQLWGPSGAAIWAAPTIDPQTNSIYVGTGDGYTQPAAATTDAVVALDLNTGAIKWVTQVTKGDAFTMACGSANVANCPTPEGPDLDFGQPPMLVTLASGKRALVLGQKSGVVHGLDPDDGGRLLWSTRIGKGGMLGGIEWGSATDGQNIYVPLSDITFKDRLQLGRGGLDPNVGGGLFAIRNSDGARVWEAHPPTCGDNCSVAQSAPSAVMPGVVFSGSIDGHFRAYSTSDGMVLWDFDTAREFPTVNGVRATGGSIDVGGPAIADGMVLTTSGYGTWGGKRGNVLLAFGIR